MSCEHGTDWAKAPAPWNTLGPEIAENLRRIARGEAGTIAWWERLRGARLTAGLSQKAASYHARVPPPRLAAAEFGHQRLGEDAVARLAKIYACEFDWLAGAIAKK